MKAIHDESHEDVVRQIVLGERSAADAPDCETCRRDIAELGAVASRLDAAGARRREVEREADTVDAAPGEDRVAPAIRALRDERLASHVPPRRIRPWTIALAAAAALILAIGLGLRREAPREPPDVTLGGEVTCEAPVGEVAAFEEFRWTAPLPAGGTFRLEIRDERAAVDAPPVVSRTLTEPVWRPTPSERDALPPQIRWTVTVRDALGAPVARGSARASLSRH